MLAVYHYSPLDIGEQEEEEDIAAGQLYVVVFMVCRDWGLVWGGVCMGMSLIPSFRNFRLFSFLALVATSFTAWYAHAHRHTECVSNAHCCNVCTKHLL